MTTRNSPLARLAAILAAVLLPLALLAGTALTAGPASAATTPRVAAGIAGVCTALQDGEYRYLGRNLYQCVYVWGLGFYWVSVPAACGTPAAARETAARLC